MNLDSLTIVDELVIGLEYDYLRAKFNETSAPYDSIFLVAQSHISSFSVYEVVRTRIEKAKPYVRSAENSGLSLKLKVGQIQLHSAVVPRHEDISGDLGVRTYSDLRAVIELPLWTH